MNNIYYSALKSMKKFCNAGVIIQCRNKRQCDLTRFWWLLDMKTVLKFCFIRSKYTVHMYAYVHKVRDF